MKKSRFSETEIVYAIKQVEAGVSVPEVARKYGVSDKTIYDWRKRYGGLTAGDLARLKQLEEENRKLKRCWDVRSQTRSRRGSPRRSTFCAANREPREGARPAFGTGARTSYCIGVAARPVLLIEPASHTWYKSTNPIGDAIAGLPPAQSSPT